MSFRLFRYAPLSVLLLSFSRAGMAEDYFDPAALELSSTEQKTADLHYFSEKGGQMPGTWLVTLEINGREERHQEITFVNEKGSLQPVFSAWGECQGHSCILPVAGGRIVHAPRGFHSGSANLL